MLKRCITILSAGLLLLTGSMEAQVFNIPADTIYQGCAPDSTHLYLFADSMKSVSYTYDTLPYYTIPTGGTSVTMSDDQVQGPFPVGFEVSWFCGSYTSFYLCSNGWIGFQNTTAAFTPQQIPSTAFNVPKNAIMGVWRDWHPGISGGPYITYQTLGVAPNRKLVVTWTNVPMYSCTSTTGTFQIVVHETSNIIHTNLTNMPTCVNWVNGDGTHGVHDPTGTIGVPVAGRNDTPFTTSYETIRFIPTSPITWSYANGQQIGIGNDLYATIPQSGYVYATGQKCNNDSVMDSVFVGVSCIYLDMDSIDVECTGDSTGYAIAIDTSLSSGTSGPYTFYWLDAAGDTIAIQNSIDSIDTLSNIPAGQYSCYAYDNTGQFAVGNVQVNEPETLTTAYTGSIDVLCNGDSSGSIWAEDTNDYSLINSWNQLYSFYWSNGSSVFDSTIYTTNSLNTVNNLEAGTYNVTVDGCYVQTGTVTLSEPAVLNANINNPTMVSCPGAQTCDASAYGNAQGGVGPFSYLWSSGETTQTAMQLCADSNFITITDTNGCTDDAFVVIDVPDTIETTAYGDTMICITNPAAIAGASNGGTPPFTYLWTKDSLTGTLVSTNSNVSVYPDTTTQYFVSSVDANGCEGDTSEVLIKVRPPLTSEISPVDTICPYDTIEIQIVGFGGDSNYTFSWSNGIFGPSNFVSPDEPKWYQVTVSDGCGTPSYKDSVFVQVGGYSKITAQINVEDDSICIGESVYLIANGRGGFRGPDEYRYNWSSPNMDDENPVQFVKPSQTTTYTLTITDLCLSKVGTVEKTVYVGAPFTPPFIADPNESCANEEVTISFADVMSGYIYNWDFGDESTLEDAFTDSVFHEYSEPGCYDVTLSVITDFGCESKRTEQCLVQILQAPKADFVNFPLNPSTLDPFVEFDDRSEFAEDIIWYLNDDTLSEEGHFFHEFQDTGRHEVALIATSEDGCKDTLIRPIFHYLDETVYVPTSFTPNGDGMNDVFKVRGEGVGKEKFELIIFDRWGQRVFYSQNPDFGWNGKFLPNGGEYVPNGSYAYTLQFIDRFGELRKIRGQIMVSKSGKNVGLR